MPRVSSVSAVLFGALLAAVAVLSLGALLPEFRPGFVVAAFAAAGIVFLLWRRDDFSAGHVVFVALCCRLLVIGLPPVLSDDAYRYVWDGFIQTRGLNPYLVLPSDPALAAIGDTELLARLNSPSYYSVYPPVSQAVFLLGSKLGRGDWLAALYIIKAVFAAMEFGAVLLLARMTSPRRLLLYACSPLVVLEAAGQAHTEAASVFFLVLTVQFVRKARPGWAAGALALAGWVKLYPFVFFPFLWNRFGWRAVWPGALVGLAVALPYWHPDAVNNVGSSLTLYVRYFEFNAGPYYFLKQVYYSSAGTDISKVLGPVLGWAFLMLLPVLYVLDRREQRPVQTVFVWAIGAFLCMATTVHPWYLLTVLALLSLTERPGWHWQWLSVCSMGTYLLYTGGPYWAFVIIGWSGFFVIAAVTRQGLLLRFIQERRAKVKAGRIISVAGGDPVRRVLDLGAAEGYVGQKVGKALSADVVLADVVDMNRTGLPLTLYDGRTLPFADGSFDLVILSYVLHHCAAPERVLAEAARVGRYIVVLESVYKSGLNLRVLTLLDMLANSWRSGGRMARQEEHLHFRTDAAWLALFNDMGLKLRAHETWGRLVHRQALYAVQRAEETPTT